MALTLSACTTIPRVETEVIIPEINPEWVEDTGELKKLESDADLEDVASTINENYAKYKTLRSNMQLIREYFDKLNKIQEDERNKNEKQ